MKQFVTIFALFTLNIIFGQTYVWNKLDGNFHQSVVFQNSIKTLQNQDSLKLTIYRFDKDEIMTISDSTKQIYAPIKLTFEDFRYKLSLHNFLPAFTINSKFLIKYHNPHQKIFQYEIYFLDTFTKKDVTDLKKYLYENFDVQKLEYISKEEAKKEAAESIGTTADELFEGNIFPASLKVELNHKINLKTIERRFKNFIDSSREITSDIGIHIFKIET